MLVYNYFSFIIFMMFSLYIIMGNVACFLKHYKLANRWFMMTDPCFPNFCAFISGILVLVDLFLGISSEQPCFSAVAMTFLLVATVLGIVFIICTVLIELISDWRRKWPEQ